MDKDSLFAQIALEKKYISGHQVHHIFGLCEKNRDLTFGQVCLREKLLTLKQVESVYGAIGSASDLGQNERRATRRQEDPLANAVNTYPGVGEITSFARDFGNYMLVEEIARGGMGIVFKARQKGINRIVALKVMRQFDAIDKEQVARFYREISTAGKLNHPNIVSVYEADKADDVAYFTMEYIDGKTLGDILKSEPPTMKAAARLMEKIARAVDYAHTQKIIHRDLKPANIIIDKEGEPHITDFGLAKDTSRNSQLTESGTALGTPHYMSPEQVEGKTKRAGAATDIYSLGIILYEMVTGKTPFSAPSLAKLYFQILSEDPERPRKVNPKIPLELEIIILKAMARVPANRYPSAKILAMDLKRFCSGKKITARAASPWRNAMKKLRPHAMWLAVLVVLSLCCMIFLVLWLSDRHSPQHKKKTASRLSPGLAKKIEKTRELFAKKRVEEAQIKAEELLAVCRDRPAVFPIYRSLAKTYLAQKQTEKALDAYQRLYLFANDPEFCEEALEGMMICCLEQKRFVSARLILRTAMERDKRVISDALAARVLFHCGDFATARPYIEKVSAEKFGKRYIDYLQCVKSLTPVAQYPCKARNIALIDLSGNGKQEFLLINKREIGVFSIEKNKWRKLYRISAPQGKEFTGKVVAGDLTEDGRLELVASARGKLGQIIIFKNKNNRFVPYLAHPSNETDLTIARIDNRDCLFIAVGAYARNTQMFRYEKGKFEVVEIDKNLKKNATDTCALDAGDIDADTRSDLLLGTGCWTFYDLRAYGCGESGFQLKAFKRLGMVTGCKIVNMDKRGKPEIFAVKSHTVNKKVFANIYGEPDGLYAFHYENGHFYEIWNHTFPAADDPRREFGHIHSGDLGLLGLSISLLYTSTCTGKAKTIEENGKSEIWLVWMQSGKFRLLNFTRESQIYDCAFGDVDGDGKDELVILEEGKLLICGISRE